MSPARDEIGAERRLALVLAAHAAAAPPGIAAAAFAAAALADSYEVLADLEQVQAGIVSALGSDRSSCDAVSDVAALLWPGDLDVRIEEHRLSDVATVVRAVSELRPEARHLLLVPADVPDLPGLVLAKVARALGRADVCCAPELGGDGLAVLGLRLPLAEWVREVLDDHPFGLDRDPGADLAARTPTRSLVARAPGWRRLRRPESALALDPGLEGWDNTRLLLEV